MYVFELRRRWRQYLRYRKPLPSKQLYNQFIRKKVIMTFGIFFPTWCFVGYMIFNNLLHDFNKDGSTIMITVEELHKRNRDAREKYYKERSEQRKNKELPVYNDPYDT
ncbi:hypothetical protein M3Y96_00098200 [Aphelenchoides besseyi]|nr:hypothetical protein M3Y96_00098200 [Aphelenchoides besseyi]